jgi:hypothetical protein
VDHRHGWPGELRFIQTTRSPIDGNLAKLSICIRAPARYITLSSVVLFGVMNRDFSLRN